MTKGKKLLFAAAPAMAAGSIARTAMMPEKGPEPVDEGPPALVAPAGEPVDQPAAKQLPASEPTSGKTSPAPDPRLDEKSVGAEEAMDPADLGRPSRTKDMVTTSS